jgi:hypothetical protein
MEWQVTHRERENSISVLDERAKTYLRDVPRENQRKAEHDGSQILNWICREYVSP